MIKKGNKLVRIGDNNIIGGEFIIQNDVEIIGEYCFEVCNTLEKIIIPPSVKEIGTCAFGYCSNLSIIVISDSVQKIGDEAFWDCSSLQNIFLSNNVELNSKWFNEYTNQKCKIRHRGHFFTVEDIIEYY